MADAQWVMDTSVFTHFHRAGHGDILRRVAPGGEVVLIPREVGDEVDRGREGYPDIPAIADCPWAQLVILDPDQNVVKLAIQVDMGADTDLEHAGEAAVIAYAASCGLTAVIDEREAVVQAEERGVVVVRDSMWIVVEAYHRFDDITKEVAEQIVDDLLATGMRLPIDQGASLIGWAYTVGYMDRAE